MMKRRYFCIVALGVLLLIIPGALSTDLLYIERITPKPGYPINITGETIFTQDVGIGTTSPGAKLDVEGNLILQYGTAINEFSTDTTLSGNSDLAVPTEKAIKTYVDAHAGSGLSGTGTANYITKWTGTTSVGNSVIYETGGNVGIGTTSPGSKLQIGTSYESSSVAQKNIRLGIASVYSTLSQTQYSVIGFYGTTVNTSDIYTQTGSENLKNFYLGIVSDLGYYNNNRFSVVQGGQERLTIGGYANGGNVGIGATSPSYKLHVNGTFYADTVNTGLGNYELYAMNQNVRTTDSPTFTRLTLSQGTGTAPLTVSSTTLVSNLNADLLDGQHGSYYSHAATSQNSIYSADTRNTNYNASDRNAGLYVDFKSNTADGLSDGGSYHGVLTFRSYGLGTDLSGGNPIQIAYTGNGNLWTRMATGTTTWGTWYKQWAQNNDGSGSGLDADLLDGHDSSYFQSAITNPVTGTGTANYITKWTGTTSVGNSVIYETGGNVGIGTTSPGQKLQVAGNIALGSTANGYQEAGSKYIGTSYANPGTNGFTGLQIESVNAPAPYNGNYSQNLKFFTHHYGAGTGGTPRMTIQYDGNVGIGTTSPSYKLHVNGTFYADTVNTGLGNYELYAMNQNVRTSDTVTFATVNTGIGATEVYLMNQNVRTTDSPTFADITISGVESNNIYTIDYPNSAITTNPPSPLASIRTALRFNWYSTDWEIGNIRGGSYDTQGFGIATNNGANLRWRVTDGTTYDYNNLQVSGSLTASTVNTGSGDKELGDAAVTDGDTNSIPTNDQVYDFVTGYVGSGGSGDIYVNEAGDNMTGDLDMNDNELFAADFVHSNAISIADTYSNGVSNRPAGYSMYVQDDIHVGGDITGVGADVAEYFYSEGNVEAGDVVVISNDIGVKKSERAYDTKVAGIVSTDPQYLMATDREGVPIAVAGTTPVKISVENGEINYGDLLTTSTKPGHAMRCRDMSLCRGAIVGKALQRATSDGVIVALVMLG